MSIRTKYVVPVFVVAMVSVVAADVAMGQGRGRGAARGQMFQGGGGTNVLQLLANEKIQGELELVEDQIQQIKDLQSSQRQAWQEMFSGMGDVPREERRGMMGDIREKLEERNKEFEKSANEILMPHQRTRLKQLKFQSAGRGRGAGGALNNEKLLEELGVSESQKEEIEKATEKAREKVTKETQKIIAIAEKDILKVLTSEQREMYRKLVGDPFEFDNGQRRVRGRNGEGGRGR